MIYAGIGSRETPPHILEMMYQLAMLYARCGYICATGAALGADQAFANGAIAGGGQVQLYLPWATYEKAWVRSLPVNQVSIRVLTDNDTAAHESVRQYHPVPEKLKQGPFKLHARNYLILEPATFVVCWTTGGKVSGGTGQGIRIATDRQKLIENIGDTQTHARLANYIRANRYGA